MSQIYKDYFEKLIREGFNMPLISDRCTAKGLRQLRRQKRENQNTFWRRFGITQSSGSRFEIGDPLPPTLALMIRLYVDGKLTDELLDQYIFQPDEFKPFTKI